MPQVDFTLEDLKQVFATRNDLERFATRDDLKQFATRDDLGRFATKDDLGRFATKDDLSAFPSRDDVRGIVREEMAEVKVELRRVKNMLEEDGRAESQRLDRVDRRSAKIGRRLTVHMADTTVHLRSNHE